MAFRIDATGTLGNVRKTPQGGIIVPANLTRVGVFKYTNQDGSVTRELRHPDEVFAPRSLASLASAPLTVGHPAAVTPSNYRSVTVGHVDGVPSRDGIFVRSDVRVQDADTIAKVDAKELTELSCGYSCDLEPTSGTFNGERYDCIQRNIAYNHVGLGPSGWGRAGSEVRLRLDSEGVLVGDPTPLTHTDTYVIVADMAETPKTAGEGNAPASTQLPTLNQDAAQLEVVRGENAFLKSELARVTAELKAAQDPKRLDSAVAARVSLEVQAKAVAPTIKCDGLSDVEIMTKVLAEVSPKLKLDGKSPDYVRGMFEAAVAQRTDAAESQSQTLKVGLDASTAAKLDTSGRNDAINEAAERAAFMSKNAWRGADWLEKNDPRNSKAGK